MVERVQKILSQWGIASRRQAEQMILEGRVRLNGDRCSLGQKADPAIDRIEVDGSLIQPAQRPELIYLLLHKPQGVVSTCSDPQHRQTVLDLLPVDLQQAQGIHPVGRLDVDSTGALLLTNDGELTFALTHPSHPVPKTYQVWVKGHPSTEAIASWRQGVLLDHRLTLPAEVEVLTVKGDRTQLKITLWEGRNRQIRRIAEQLGYPVIHLHRISIGSIRLQHLPLGEYRYLTGTEVEFLKSQI
mgnify:CR=1 FL=1